MMLRGEVKKVEVVLISLVEFAVGMLKWGKEEAVDILSSVR